MKNYANEEIIYEGCPGCAYANHDFTIPCGIAFENERFTVSQDWELPIEGFFIVSPKRHVEKLVDLSKEEKLEMFELVEKTISILRNNNVALEFEIIFEERNNRHFHIWIMPRHDWMHNVTSSIIDNISLVHNYALNNFRNEESYNKIKNVSDIVRDNLK